MSLNSRTPRLLLQLSKFTLKGNFCTPSTTLTTCLRSNVKMDKRNLQLYSVLRGTAGHKETTSMTQGLTKLQAQELILRLNDEERNILTTALHEYQSKLVKDEYEGQLAASRWRSKFGRPSKLPSLGDVDPTGTYCPVPEDWLIKKVAASVPKPTTKNLVDIAIANSIPFIGFGFLDNFFMLIFGDYIDLYLGSYLCLSTMAAAALGNTLSDILGIGTAFYVERLANRIGFTPPKLSPIQMDMNCSRRAANLGRVLGVTIGCCLGMCPLFFKLKGSSDEEKLEET
ncbi:transmembrane protein 65 isoform X1 [Rhynchophorus ferrugineus]|uniref:transmembrane protein 65 isoform X1 n=1 Tax=Rhynchophorus ferrugineus TaxID=354439 RepID=UPI003FCEE437